MIHVDDSLGYSRGEMLVSELLCGESTGQVVDNLGHLREFCKRRHSNVHPSFNVTISNGH